MNKVFGLRAVCCRFFRASLLSAGSGWTSLNWVVMFAEQTGSVPGSGLPDAQSGSRLRAVHVKSRSYDLTTHWLTQPWWAWVTVAEKSAR